MNKKMIFKQLMLILVTAFLSFGGCVCAQQYPTDTVYHSVFGCDSVTLSANGAVYYQDTTVKIPHYAPVQGQIVMDVLNVYQIAVGRSYDVKDTVTARVCKNNLPYAFRSHFYTQSGDYWVSTPTTKGCDSAMTMLRLQVVEGQHTSVNLPMCSDQDSVTYDNITFKNVGSYDFIQGYNADGCPIVKTYVVTRYPMESDTVRAEICQSELPYVFKGQSYMSSGTYTIPYLSPLGCNALAVLILQVRPDTLVMDTLNATVCAVDLPYIYKGVEYNAAGTYQVDLKNQYGCDSVHVTLDLQVNNPQTDTVVVSLCREGFPYSYDSAHVFNAPGRYFIDQAPDSACSQYTVLVLNEKPSVHDTVNVCTSESSYSFGDTVFTASTLYTYSKVNDDGCLDYHTIRLTLNNQTEQETQVAAVCESQTPYLFYGNECDTTGLYSVTLKSVDGCDSVTVTLDLTVRPDNYVAESVTVTRNALPYHYYDSIFTESGVYAVRVPAATAAECDTIRTLNLTVMPVFNTTVDTTVCANAAVQFLGDSIKEAGAYQYTYHLAGYDSVVTLNVHHNPVYVAETIQAEVGEYDLPYYFIDSAYYTPGYHEVTLSSVNGCDSVVSFFLKVNPAVINTDTVFREVCSNEMPVTLYDSVLAAPGLYRFLTRSVSSYDSVFYVRLTVKESPTLSLNGNPYLCTGSEVTLTAQSTGGVFLWSNGSTQSSITVSVAGTYSVTVSNAFECSAAASVEVQSVTPPPADILGYDHVCEGGSVLLQAIGGTSFAWEDGTTNNIRTVTPATTTTYTVTVFNTYGCSNTKSLKVTVNALPTVALTGNSSICEGQSTILYATGGVTYYWNTGAHASRITVSNAGTYSVTVTDANNCTNKASVEVAVHGQPNVKINGRTALCQGGSTTLTAAGASTYEWNSGEVTQSITTSYTGTYTVTGTDQYGCTASKSVTVSQAPVNATILGSRFLCHGQSTVLTASGDEDNTYRWFDGSTSSDITITAAGQYTLTVTNAGGCQGTLSATVSEYNTTPPTISGNLTICEGQSTVLRASGGNSYEWDDGSTHALITVNATGTYSVTSTNSYGCTASNSVTVLVNPAPVVNIVAQESVCRGESVVLTAISPAGTFHWSTGQNTAAVTVTPSVSTNYTVLVTDDNGCSATATKQVTVNPLPSVFVNGPSSLCYGDTAVITAIGGVAYQWNTGRYENSIGVTSTGTYTVTATGENGCTASASKTVTVNALPIASVTETASVCRGQQAQLIADAPAGCTFLWSTGSHQSRITTTEAGEYTVTVTNANLCSQVYHASVTVYELPQIGIVGTSEICQGQSTTLTVAGEGVVQYAWSNGDHNPSTTVDAAGQYSVTATNTYGCTATASRGVVVHELPTPQINGNLVICKGKSTTLSATGGVTYLWNTGNTGSNIAVAPSANQSYSVMASNAYGCMASTAVTVTVNELPTVTFSGNTVICDGESASITASGANTYSWSTGSQDASVTLSHAGSYKVTATDAQSCSNTATVTVEVNANPNVQISGAYYVCSGEATQLTASGAASYQWNTQETTASVTVSPVTQTTYTVTGYDTNGCHSTSSKVVNVEALPVISVSGTRTICAGQSTTLTATGGASYLWSNGSTGNSITVSPATTQSYVVTVTNTLGCVSSKETQVTVNTLPQITFSGNTEMCDGGTVNITAAGGDTYNWSTGSATPAVTVSAAGYYKVTVTNAENCVNSDSVYVTVHQNPNVQITGSDYICAGAVTSLTATGANTYVWSTAETGDAIAVSPSATLTYTVTGYDARGCQSLATKVLNVEALPTIIVSGVKTVCEGQSTTLTATGGSAYVWDNGSTNNSITVTPASSQSYVVTVTNALGCSSSLSTMVTVNTLPQISFTGNTTICAGNTTTLTAMGASSYSWSNGGQNAAVTVSEEGYYRVTATNAQNCVNTDSVFVKVNANPVVQIASPNYVCSGGVATLTASGANSYLWNTEEVSPSISVTPSTATTYTVTGYDTNGCSTTVSRVLNVEALPVIQVLGTRTICAGQFATLTATGGSTYSWSTGDTVNSVQVSPESTQSYVVTVTNAYGCRASSAVTITVNPLPHLTINGNTTICSGNTTTISLVGASTYQWSTGAQTANVNIATTGMYYVTATNALNCSKVDSVYVKVNPRPTVQIAGSNHVCAGSAISLTASGANTYQWNTGENSSSISVSPTANTTYSVTGYDTNGCYSVVQKVVNVEEVPVAQILGERTICAGQSTVLTAIGGTSYSWSNGSTTQDIAVFPNINTTYTVTAYNDFGCSSVTSAVVVVNVLPSIIFSGNTSICQGQSTTISVVGGTSYTWNTGTTGNSITVSTPGVYKVNAVNSLNCLRTDSVTVVVWDNPTINISGSGLICQGTTATLTASGASSYSWSTGEAGPAVLVMPEETTTYSVIGYDDNGCSSTVSKVVNVEVAPAVHVSGDLAICHGQSTTLTASDAAAYQWSTGAATNSITVSTQGAYTVTASSVNGCQSMASVTVIDNPVPVFALNGVSTICENTTEVLSVTGDNSYQWNTGSTEGQITISTGGIYTVTATNAYGCSQTSSVYVAQLAAPTLDIVGVGALCQGDSTDLVASSDADQYLWSTGDTTQSVTVIPDNTLYTVTVTGNNGCSTIGQHQVVTLPTYNMTVTGTVCEGQPYSDYGFEIPTLDTAGTFTYTRHLQTVKGCDSTVNLLLTVNPLPRLDTINGNPNITQYGNNYFSINNPLYVSNYEWRVSNTHWTLSNTSFSNVTLNVTTNGTGVLTARGINNCGYTETSIDLYCNVGIEDYPSQAQVTLYPNPVHQSLFINLENASEVAMVRLYDETGRLVYQTRCDDTRLEIDCTRFANGHYTVQFLGENGRKVESRKIIVNNK